MKTNGELIASFYTLFSDFDINNINSRYEIITFSIKGKELFRIYSLKTLSDKSDIYTWYINIPVLDESVRIPTKNFKSFIEIFRKKIEVLINIQNTLEDFRMDVILLKNKEVLKSLIRENKLNKLL